MSLLELLAQRAELQERIAALQGEARADAIAAVRSLMTQYGLTTADISGRTRPAAADGSSKVRERIKAPIKFRNMTTGETWSGRGNQPKWLRAALDAGDSLDSFRV